MAVDVSVIQIDLSLDDHLNDFTKQTIRERYMLPHETSPQHAFARASAAFADDAAHAQRLYDYVAHKRWFMFATPLLSNGGSERGLPISCFLLSTEDSREGILDHFAEVGWLSSVGGGVGGHWGDLRSNGEKTSKGSASTGIVPFIATVDREILAFSQGGTRRGSYAAYLDIHHPEIEEFITMRKPTGGDQNRKGTNIHNAVNITDEFMEAVRDNRQFALRSPKTGETIKMVSARQLWRLLIETRMQTGEPYMVFIDTINRAFPEAQKKLGLKAKQSNLCVTGYTQILTRNGYAAIGALAGEEIEAWNGLEWSKVTIRRTSDNAELVRVWFDDGDYIDCTPEHKFYTTSGLKTAVELRDGDTLDQGLHPTVGMARGIYLDKNDPHVSASFSFAGGWATFAGFESNNRVAVYAANTVLESYLKSLLFASVDSEMDDQGGMIVRFEPKSLPAGHAPHYLGVMERQEWLLGAIAAVGTPFYDEDERENWTVVGSSDADLIRDVRLLALSVGIHPRIRLTDTMNVLMFHDDDITALMERDNIGTPVEVRVSDVQPLPFRMETFCATEPKRGHLTLNGYVTGNCTEITLATGRDIFDKMRTAVCCLSSINAEKMEEWDETPETLMQFVEDLMRMLDNALTNFIETAPPALKNAVYSAMRERSIGIGVLGWQALLQKKGYAMHDPEATALNIELFSKLRRAANLISLKLGTERGEAPDMVGTGERFAHKLAVAPNASSSILLGTSPSIEPHRANAYLHKTLSGSFPVKNQYLVEALRDLDLDNDATWQSIIAHEGSVQHLDIPQRIKNIFRTAPEIDQMTLVWHAAERAPFICQAQSLNLFFEHDATARELSEAHYKAWELGVKSLYYLRSTTPKRAENTNTKVERIKMNEDAPKPDDEGCQACEG